MSKAFTKDDGPAEPDVIPARRPLPAGAINYVTPGGLAALRAELTQLHAERAAIAALPSEVERAAGAASVSGRIHALEERIACAVRVDPAGHPRDEVRFGARVTVRGDGGERAYEIVGVDEADASLGRVAFLAPVARALLGKRVGEGVTIRTPRGEEEVEVVGIA